MCDTIGTSIMYIGLTMTNAGSFQMLRGSVIVFTGILSVGFLERKLGGQKWSGIGLVIIGLVIVGLADIITMKDAKQDTNSVITGDLLIVCAQVCLNFKRSIGMIDIFKLFNFWRFEFLFFYDFSILEIQFGNLEVS